MMYEMFFLLFLTFAIYGSEIPNFDDISKSKDAVFFLSTTRSGTNLVSASLLAITRKPISWIGWKNSVFDPSSEWTKHPSYNRLDLPLISNKPLVYRTHEATELMNIPTMQNKLIFVTRNPKELLFRDFLLKSQSYEMPDNQFIEIFLNEYLNIFKAYDAWYSENKFIIFYEDFITRGDELLLEILQFMGEDPLFWNDYIDNKQKYLSIMLESYTQQHQNMSGGLSSRRGPKAIYYSKEANLETLIYIDEYIKKLEPQIWEEHLKRFQVTPPSG